ncbi:MAG: hydroxymethylglutaryl-CoA reductase, degradative [Flavobacteriaceae bacterium]
MKRKISGFSKLSKNEKIDWIIKVFFKNDISKRKILTDYWNSNKKIQTIHDEFIENSISNFYLPIGVAPNFVINGKDYTLPMAIEESSVVAASSRAAKYWSTRGGFKTEVLGVEKIGHVHFIFNGENKKIISFFKIIKKNLIKSTSDLTINMNSRGGGITSVSLINNTNKMKGYFQIEVGFKTANSMGANFINTCLEKIADELLLEAKKYNSFSKKEKNIKIIMSILSNYTPNSIVKVSVCCPIKNLESESNMSKKEFCDKFIKAVKIGEIDIYRAVTNNKGIMNGIDALLIATGNDFRAVDAGIHAYASRNGKYSSLSSAWIKNDEFNFQMTIPLSVGTVGGIINLHPMAKWSLNLLNNPNSNQLMQIISAAGLAQNFAAIRSLITSGIQKGHMKMHLLNILNQLKATSIQKEKAILHFKKNKISFNSVSNFLNNSL